MTVSNIAEFLPGIILSSFIFAATVVFALLNLKRSRNKTPYNLTLEEADKLNGYDFEEFAAFLLSKNGAEIINVTKKSGDFGADIIIKLDNEIIAVQCKRNSGNIGVKAVQEAKTAENYYGAKRSAVITNSHFTKQAISLANENDVILWDREVLFEFINNAKEKTGKTNPPNILQNASVQITPIIEPAFPCNGIELTVNKNEQRLFLSGEKIIMFNVREGNSILFFKSGRIKSKINFSAVSGERICYAAGRKGKKLIVYKIKR